MKNLITFMHKMKEAIRLELRAIKTIHRYSPGYFPSWMLNSILSTISPFINVYLSAQIIREITGNKHPETLWKWVLITLITNTLMKFAETAASRWNAYCAETLFHYGMPKVYSDKLQQMDFSIIDKQETFDLLSQIRQNRLLGRWGLIYSGQLITTFTALFISIISTISLCWELFASPVPSSAGSLTILNHPLFTVGILVVLLAAAYFTSVLAAKGSSLLAEYASEGRQGNRIFSFYSYYCNQPERALDMRIYNQQDICEHYNRNEDRFGVNSGYDKLCKGKMGLLHSASSMGSQVFTGLIYLYVCLKAWAGAFAIGAVTQYIGAFVTLFSSISQTIQDVGKALDNTEFLKMTFDFLDIPNEMYQGSLTTEKRSDREYHVEFRNVSFKYPGSDTYALRNVSMKFTVGSRLAVVGMNGSGKTTFIKLLCRLYDPTEGEILLNGINIRKYNYHDYISVFSVVFQDFQLLSLPLGQNVAASVNFDTERVLDCLKKAGFAEKLAEMPQGLNTYLNKDFKEDGVTVSGGEAQKIAIARALYKDAPFIILDEPTAALDPIAEAEIYSKFDEIAGDKTAIYISHRLSSCRFCDDILVFHEGSVIQQGSHESLVSDVDGKYYELWNAQAQYYV